MSCYVSHIECLEVYVLLNKVNKILNNIIKVIEVAILCNKNEVIEYFILQ